MNIPSEFLREFYAAGRSPDTIRSYRSLLTPFLAQFDSYGAITEEAFPTYVEHRRRSGCKPTTVRTTAMVVARFLRWAVERHHISSDALSTIHVPRRAQVRIQPFSRVDLQHLLTAAERGLMPERDVAIVMLLADTGIRASELCGIRDKDIRGSQVEVFGKGGKWRSVFASATTLEAVARWVAVRGEKAPRLFLSRNGLPLTRGTLRQMFARLGLRGGVDGVRCSPHTVRHTVGIEWVRSGGDIRTLKELLGHADYMMVDRYVKIAATDVEKAHRRHGLVERLSR